MTTPHHSWAARAPLGTHVRQQHGLIGNDQLRVRKAVA